MSEEDPELREKLWQEYLRYKKGTGSPGSTKREEDEDPPESAKDETDEH